MKLVRITKLPQKKLFEVSRKSFIKEKKEKCYNNENEKFIIISHYNPPKEQYLILYIIFMYYNKGI